jgi:hypothetical protein
MSPLPSPLHLSLRACERLGRWRAALPGLGEAASP